ncbi:hypothetical protein BG015_003244 [Linnemannia schmuckeri]|uniref:Uncharacterized protein n=1 Tax=Linnemannia schmuckeri TaxID=64567 RepID=A0A9P5VF42_9FUNG|nr:hypothetical protein BG015_003244 [Linnemannia schmuckeri]
MKFAKHLQEEVVPEWRKAYMNYKLSKKYLKAIEAAIDQLEDNEENSRHNNIKRHGPLTVDIEAASSIERPATAHSPKYPDSPTGTTPIIKKGRGSLKSYDTILIPPARSATLPPLSSSSDSALNGTDQDSSAPHDPQQRQLTHRPSIATLTDRPVVPRRDSFVAQMGEAARSQSHSVFKSLQRSFTKATIPQERRVRARAINLEGRPLDSVKDQMLEEERDFFRFLDSQLAMVDAFYREKELESVTKLKVLKQQLFVADEWKRRQDLRKAKAEARRGWYQAEWSRVRDGFGSFMGDPTYAEDVTIGPFHRTHSDPLYQAKNTTVGFSTGAETAVLRNEAGGNGKAPENSLRFRDSRTAIDGHPVCSVSGHNQVVIDDEETRRQHLNHKVARSRIKAAIYEFYRSMEMLKNYKVLNKTGFIKIMKKFDKTAGWKASKEFQASKLNTAYFISSTTLDDLISETEDLYIEKFEKGHRRRGMAKLRIPDGRNQPHHSTIARVGLYIGIALPLFILGLQSAFSEDTESEIPFWSGLLLVYAGLFLTVLFACLFGINMYVWAKARINYKFIFEFDPRDNLDYTQFYELPTFFMMALCIALYLDFVVGLTSPSIFRTYYPLILIGLILVVLFWPLRMFRFGARRWFLQSIWRIVASGYYKVEFRDFFMADEMNSLVYSIEQFEFMICAYTQQWNDLGAKCATSHMWITPFVTALPAWFRFLQCLRRYRDTLEWFPHLLNAGKYTCSLIQLFVYFSFRHYGGNSLKAGYIVISLITSTYTFAWDIHMDWGLLQFGKHGGAAYGNPFLRPELVYSRKWVYYLAIVLDFLGRFSWVLRFVPMNVNVMVLSFSLALAEVLRRWMWNFFRLENEHLNNCGHFRAIKDIPLPFHIRVAGDSDDEDEDDEGEGDENAEGMSAKNNGSDTDDGEQSGIGTGTGQSKQHHRLGAGTSQASFQSGATSPQSGAVRRPAPKRRSSSASSFGPPFGLDRSNTFVDDALGQAGFASEQLEQLASSAFSKFYDRRDFESRIDGGEESYRSHKARSNKAPMTTTTSRVSTGLGLGINSSASGGGAAEPVGASDSTSTRTKPSLGNMIKSGIRVWRDDEDDDEDDDDSDDDGR